MRTAVLAVVFVLASVSSVAGQSRDTLRVGEVMDEALRENPQAQIARNDLELAENDRTLGNAGFLPNAGVTGSFNETISDVEQTIQGDSVISASGIRRTTWNANADARWRLFDGLGRFATYDRLDAEAERQRANTRARLDVLLADVLTTYYDVARQQQQLAVFREAVDVSRERLRIAQSRRDLGSASDLEVRQARVDLNADSASVLRQQVVLVTAKQRLNRLLGRRRGGTEYVVSERIDVDQELAPSTLEQAAFDRSPALKDARQGLRVAEAELREVRANFFPALDAVVGAGFSEFEGGTGFLVRSETYDLTYGLSLTFTLFDGLNRSRRRQNAQIRIRNAELVVEDVETQIETDLGSAFEDYRNRLRLVTLERDNLGVAEANVEVALEQFRLGTITSVELREVQEQLIRARSQLLDARFQAKRAETELLRLSGQLSEDTFR